MRGFGYAGDFPGGQLDYTQCPGRTPVLHPVVTPDPVVQGEPATATANATSGTGYPITSESCDPVSTAHVGTSTVTCTAADSKGNHSSAGVSYTVVPRAADLSVSIVAPAGAVAGSSSTVGVGVGDAGPARADRVAWRLTVHDGARITAAPGGTIARNGRSVQWWAASLAAGTRTDRSVTVSTQASAHGRLHLSAVVVSHGTRDPALRNNAAGATTTITR